MALVGFGNSLWHPTAIPTLGRRYPERKGFALSIHGMGGNVGDAVAPVLIGAALGFFTWREVVVMNVVPGLVVALLLLAFLGMSRLGAKKAEGEAQSLATYVAGLRLLLRNRALVLLSTGSALEYRRALRRASGRRGDRAAARRHGRRSLRPRPGAAPSS